MMVDYIALQLVTIFVIAVVRDCNSGRQATASNSTLQATENLDIVLLCSSWDVAPGAVRSSLVVEHAHLHKLSLSARGEIRRIFNAH